MLRVIFAPECAEEVRDGATFELVDIASGTVLASEPATSAAGAHGHLVVGTSRRVSKIPGVDPSTKIVTFKSEFIK